MTTPQSRLVELINEGNALAVKGILSTDEQRRMGEILTEGSTLREQIALQTKMGELNAYANQSAGGLPLANSRGAQVVNIKEAGATTVEITDNGRTTGIKMLEQYGEGIMSPSQIAVTGTDGYREAFKAYMRRGERGLKDAHIKTLQEGIDTEGGFTVPQDVLDRIIVKEPTPTRVAGRVTQLQTSRDTLTIPRVNYTTDDLYTSGIRVTWTGEIPASSTTMRVTDPVFGQSKIPVYTAMLSIPVTNDMVEDASFPLVSWIAGKFAETVDLLRDNMVLNGTGLGQPSGILFNPGDSAGTQPAVVKTGQSATLGSSGGNIFANLANLAFSLPEQYDMNGTFVMNKVSTANTLAQQVDSNSRPLWGLGYQESGYAANYRDRPLLGYPVTLSGFMPNVAASAYPIIFGDLAGYYLVNRVGFSVQVLRELYAETNQILILGRLRFGGQIVEPWRLKILQCHT